MISASNLSAQVGEHEGCVFVDFEDILGSSPTDGMTIADQFYDKYGVRFRLEDGSSPVLARVGPPATAFSSAWGSDTPAPSEDIGQYFITDNGTLQGLQAIPLIVTFDFPLDSLGGCILDLDFGEEFRIDALDENGDILERYVFRAGDPNTGDGIATCFGYNMEGCEGSIYGLRFSGTRTTPGGFGLGMDNFSFCFTGIDIINNIDVDVTQLSCDETAIELTNKGSDNYMYSLDDITYVDSSSFVIDGPGIYTIYVVNEDGCKADFDVNVENRGPLMLEVQGLGHTTCGETNGTLDISSNASSATYYLEGYPPQENGLFSNLPAGTYQLIIEDEIGCRDTTSITIDPSSDIELQILSQIDENCLLGNGSITVEGSSGSSDPLSYGLSLTDLQSSGTFEQLSAGNYQVFATDGAGCTKSIDVTLQNGGNIILNYLTTTPIDCDTDGGTLTISASGGIGELTYSIGGVATNDPQIIGLPQGNQELIVTDEEGCELIEPFDIGGPQCPIMLPNIIDATSNDIQQYFLLKTNPRYDVEVINYMIFDRWGNLVHKSGGWTIHEGKDWWWDGTFAGKPVEPGVYAYKIDVRHANGQGETLTGDLTVIR